MSLEAFLVWLLIGAIAGWLAGVIVKGYGFGLLGNIAVGIVGAIVGGLLLGGLTGATFVGSLLSATIGAVLLLLVLRVVRRAS